MREQKQRLLCVVGPTASGKTTLGATLALRLNGEVISADSMQLYRGLHIASAAPEPEELCGVPHHMIEFLEPNEEYTVADYVTQARRLIGEISARGRLPMLVGGTGQYISAIADHIRFVPQPSDPELRAALTAEMEQSGAETLLRRLAEIDPQTAARLHPNNRRRIIRALELYETTGRTMTELNAASRTEESPYDPLLIGITCRDRTWLYERIDHRVEQMLSRGLAEEARACMNEHGGAGQAIGHKELYGYLRGEMSLREATEQLCRATRRYAKRQLTWFRRDERIHWLYADETPDLTAAAMEIVYHEWGGPK